VIKSTLSEPLLIRKKASRTVFYCSIKLPSSASPIRPTTILKPRTLKEIKRIKNTKTSPIPLSPTLPSNIEEAETLSSTCSSTASSGYFSNSSTNYPRHIQTPLSSYPLKSCLKRAKNEDLIRSPTTANVLAVGVAGDIFTFATRFGDNKIETSRHRRYSAPTLPSNQHNFSLQFRTQNKICTLSEHDLRAKKSVSFCDEITRRLITPSSSPKHRLPSYQGSPFDFFYYQFEV
jgi:hypothetical protein